VGDGVSSHHDAGLGVTGTMAASASGVAAAAGIGAVAIALRKKNVKCVWCSSTVKRDEPVCSRCGVHQECQTCGTTLYKTTLVSKGFSAKPQDQGLFCDRCKAFTT
jgi:membrane protease subunit (stomatin/prohibitin family)